MRVELTDENFYTSWQEQILEKSSFQKIKGFLQDMARFDPRNPLNRPSTPPSTTWFEFLLDEQLLEKHLAKEHPGI